MPSAVLPAATNVTRDLEEMVSSRERASHEAVAVVPSAAGLFWLEACERDAVAIDESKVRIDGE